MLDGRISQVNGQDQIVQSVNCGYSYVKAASFDKEKTANERLLFK